MKQQVQTVLDELRRCGDRIDVSGRRSVSEQLAARAMSIARVAASMHMTHVSRLGDAAMSRRFLSAHEETSR